MTLTASSLTSNRGVKRLTGKLPRELETKHLWKAIHWNKQFFAELEDYLADEDYGYDSSQDALEP